MSRDGGRPPFDDLARLTSDSARREFFQRRPELLDGSLVDSLCREVSRRFGIDLERARDLAGTARWLANELDDDLGRARSDRAAANVAHSLGNSERAHELYSRALATFERLGEDKEAAITRSSSLMNLAFLGEYQRVREWQTAARSVFRRQGDRRRLAILDNNYGNVLYRQDRWDEALEHYTSAHRVFLSLESTQDVAICLRNIATCHISLHRFDDALEAYEANRDHCRRHGLSRILLQVNYNIAYLYYLRGEYTHAIRLFQASRRDCEAAGDDYHQALCDLDQAEIFLELNMVEEAAQLAGSAHAAFDRLRLPYESAKALTNQAIAASRRGHGADALELLGRAREIFVREENRLWPALIDFYRAVVLSRARRPRAAVRLARGARETFLRSALAPRAAMCGLLLAELLLELEQPEKARAACHDALAGLEELELPALEHRAYLVLGQVEEATGDLSAALTAYRRSQAWLEKLRSELQGEDLKIAFLKDKHVVYENLVWLTLCRGPGDEHQRQAYRDIEKAKSRGLADLMAFRAHDLPPRTPEESGLAEKVRPLREELNWLYRRVDAEAMQGGERSRREVRRLRAGIRGKEDELLRLLREVQSTDREFGSLQSGAVVDLETLRRSLPPETTLVEYYVARGRVLVAVVDRDRLEIVPLTTAARARELHRLLQFQLSRLASGERHGGRKPLVEEATEAHLRELYDELIAPVRRYLDREHLVFVPHGFLHYLPFHALHDGHEYLIDRYSISYAPSAGVFYLCATKETACEDRSLVLGVADDRAPHILEEARAVAESLPDSTLLLGEDASEEALRRHGTGCRFLHIATHGLFRRDNPMFSAIQLGATRLSLFDLYDLRLGAELVVLSGCGTGLNAVLGAEELVGLTRGLLYAGAQSVLVTLWDVNDASTAAFMRGFYQHLARGRERAPSLRRAMRELRDQYPHPYHWAPFVLIGKPASGSFPAPASKNSRN